MRKGRLVALTTALLTVSFVGSVAAQRPNSSVDMSAFDLQKHPVLKAFRRSTMHDHEQISSMEAGATAIRKDHFFRGPNELTYSVLYFDTPQALQQWYKTAMRESNGVPFLLGSGSPGHTKPISVGTLPMKQEDLAWRRAAIRQHSKRDHFPVDRRTLEKWARDDFTSCRSEMVVGQIVLIVYGFQHSEAIRRSHAKAGDFLTNTQMRTAVEKVIKELARRAKSFRPAPGH